MASRKQKRILIVDDNNDLRRLYAVGLNQNGFEVKLAANGAEALERLETDRPDLIVLDVFMPLMDGFEFLEKISEQTVAIPVIVVSGQSSMDDAPNHPAVRFWLSKPVSIAELVVKITDCLTSQAKRPAVSA